MTRHADVCEYVQDGDTFRTVRQSWIRLARVNAPELETFRGAEAKNILSNLILKKGIGYEQVGISYNRIVAEVWLGSLNVNDYMRQQGYV